MNDYYEVRIDLNPCTEDMTDLMAAMLADEGYESFVPDDHGLTAYVKAADFAGDTLARVIDTFPMATEITARSAMIKGRDWNAEWEKNYFKPIVVDSRCAIHSSFHTDVPEADYDIVIDPKMAFGTGHHATTTLMLEQLLDMELSGKTVIDMGTGTGILAILSAMRGAAPVTGIEIDEMAYLNALDNVKLNHHPEIRIVHGDASNLEGMQPADVFIANINRNIITSDLPRYAKALKPGGRMLLSGFYAGGDSDVVAQAAAPLGLAPVSLTSKDNGWCCLVLTAQA